MALWSVPRLVESGNVPIVHDVSVGRVDDVTKENEGTSFSCNTISFLLVS